MNEHPETQAIPTSWQLEEDYRYQELFQSSPDPMWVYDEETFKFLAVNGAATQLYGYSREEFLEMTLKDIRPSTDIPALLEAVSKQRVFVLAHGGVWRHRKKDGTLIDVDISVSAVNFQGRAARLVLAHNVSERKRAEDALREMREELEKSVQARTADLEAANEALVESQERFRQMAENIRDVFWLSNPAMTNIIYVSPAYQDIWGRSCDELYEDPRTWFDAIHHEDRPRVRRLFKRPIPEEGYEHTYRVVRPDGSVRWVMDRGFPVRNPVGLFYRLVGIARDITERKELETEILAISEREQRRIGQDLHDDICQQLVGIEFLSKALEHQLKATPQAAQAGEIAQLIREAIEHTRLLARGLAPIQLEAEGLMEALRALAARTSHFFRIECSFRCAALALIDDVTVGTYLYRIAQEAVTNAIKHGKAKHIEIRLSGANDGLMLAIQDDGIGFPAKAGNLSGMGLRIMQYRADIIGGHFMIETGPEAGTTVVCTVPVRGVKPNK